jgi:hypothetical protein
VIALLLRLALDPVAASHAGAALAGAPELGEQLVVIARRESALELVGIHDGRPVDGTETRRGLVDARRARPGRSLRAAELVAVARGARCAAGVGLGRGTARELVVGLCFASATLFAALVEAKHWSIEGALRERVAVLEERYELLEKWRVSFRDRMDAVEATLREHPYRRRPRK